MATLVLSAAGAAVSGSFGGSIAGISTLAMGKAAGAMLGNSIDQMILGAGAAPVQTGRVDQFRVMGASEGTPLPRVFGRTRVAGQLIWSSRFLETVNQQNVGGKGGGQKVKEFSYSISVALALCEGEVVRIGRIWADGQVVDQSDLVMRLHRGTESQIPDPLIAAIEGSDSAPAYRGTAYVVLENLQLAPFGNRIPQLNFEVIRRPEVDEAVAGRNPVKDIKGVALVPGTGEYSLAAQPVKYSRTNGETIYVNVHNDLGKPDFVASMEQMEAELPQADAVSLVVSWFGDDLRCSHCSLQPMVEQKLEDGDPIRWEVSGATRDEARQVSLIDGIPLFGGTPADATVVESIRYMRARNKRVMFYPFILMDITEENELPDPWSNGVQPVVPWRGRITLSKAPGREGSPDKTSEAGYQVDAFFGSASLDDFKIEGDRVTYVGTDGWTYRRFVLHYAHLCAVAGGVESFCIGSEFRGLTSIRDSAAGYPSVEKLRELAADVRAVLGSDVKIGYAADWSEYFGHRPDDGSNDVIFHLDPLWADPDIDFIGIDNYMPLSDWRDASEHADADFGSIYSMDYLTRNVAGGEGYDWYYADAQGREDQTRIPIEDTAYGEDWVFRNKDIKSWWSNRHYNRIGGVKRDEPTEWLPESKPVWFSELGCPAVDKGTNQPNVFHDPKSSESFFPYYSSGARDDFIQYRYLQAMFAYWEDDRHNPRSGEYDGTMVDLSHAYVWAWDARPWPDFPARTETWTDGVNYARGHWLNGRTCSASLAEVVAEVTDRSGVSDVRLDDLHGMVTGYSINDIETARQSLQPLQQVYGFDSFSSGKDLEFVSRGTGRAHEIMRSDFVQHGTEADQTLKRVPNIEAAGRVVLGYVDGGNDYSSGAVEAVDPENSEPHTSRTSYPIVLGSGEAKTVVNRWLSESQVARDQISFVLPPSSLRVMAGDSISLIHGQLKATYRVDRIDELGHRVVNAVRTDTGLFVKEFFQEPDLTVPRIDKIGPVNYRFLDIPLLRGTEVPYAPHFAVSSYPWQSNVSVYSSSSETDNGYTKNIEVTQPSVIGQTLDAIPAGRPGEWLNSGFRVRITAGVLSSRSEAEVLNGANVAAVRGHENADWEIIQFQSAELQGPNEYLLSKLLRGQAGTDAVTPRSWPPNCDFVVLDGAQQQIDIAQSARGLERHYRVGPAHKSYDSDTYRYETLAFEGVGLRPYAPVHLSAQIRANGDIFVSWVRRTRIDGDSWAGFDVPLGEQSEKYHVKIFDGTTLVADKTVNNPGFLYSQQDKAVHGISTSKQLAFEIAQISESYGPGPCQRIELNEQNG
ncbi:baseplate multidomain protein megatron [Amaricoccus tamworthensis]|uniref:baseplate multidomain protein megatron n=1 Tax=Amaricoccus tamworthensis TaxID=57002 RepID=UPI003C7C9323